MGRLTRAFYAQPSLEVAPLLIGKIIVHDDPEGRISGRIVETEAYTGQTDPGSHAFRGPTPRNSVMFGPAGYLYVYVSYGMHFCVNVVTDSSEIAGAVLLRALEPLAGIEIMQKRRGPRAPVDLCNGPGKLCQALGVTKRYNGADLERSDVWIEDDGVPAPAIATSTRIGLSAGQDLPYRFFAEGSPFVSRGRPSSARRGT